MNTTNISEVMEKLGISDTETMIYLKLLEIGPSSIADLTRKVEIPRTTVRENVERLMQKGLLSQTVNHSRKKLVAEDLNKIKVLIMEKKLDLENKFKQIESVEKNFEEFIESFNTTSVRNDNRAEVNIRYYEGKTSVKSYYYKTVTEEEVYSYANLDKYYEVFEYGLGVQKRAVEQKISRNVRDILVDTPLAREVIKKRMEGGYSKNYKVKFIPAESHFSGFDFIIFNDSVALIQLEKQNPYVIEVKSSSIAAGFKSFHVALWSLLGDN
ncbi:hypothetical protein JW887_02985 [Candidatus Dojkabacteria bacterium]|nr:hypothetical protein [Candidatus Dojkabacteria bacterium]